MLTGEAVRMQEQADRRIRVIRPTGKIRWHFAWDNNPRFARPDEQGHFFTIRAGGGRRPYIAQKTRERWFWRDDWSPHPGEFYPTDAERALGDSLDGYLIIEPNLKLRASPNKDWGWKRWQGLVDALPDLPWAQVGPMGMPVLRGVSHLITASFRDAWAVLRTSIGYVGPEGGLHHAAAAVGVPAVVLFGGYISPLQTGYDMHRNLFTGGEPCGMRLPCEHCKAAMEAITVDRVVDEVRCILGETVQ